MADKTKNGKKKWIIILFGIVAVLGIGIGLFFVLGKKDGYRVIQIYELDGEATLERKGVGEMEAYENLMLKQEDLLRTKADSTLRLKMDEDKFMLLDPETEIQLFASGNSKNSKTDIKLNYGAVTVDIREKLSEKSSYEITTPNSVMAVRGTVFCVKVYLDENNEWVTEIMALEGKLSVAKMEDGISSDEVQLESGKQAIIKEEQEELKIILMDEIDVKALSLESLKFLKDVIGEGRTLCISEDEIDKLIEDFSREEEQEKPQEEDAEAVEYTVKFMYQGNVFGTQKVLKGELAEKPKLVPNSEGKWNFDFNTPITEDTIIEFQ